MSVPHVTSVLTDFTRRLSCRSGDFLWWMRPRGGLLGALAGAGEWDMPDYWCLGDGSAVVVTNRSVDLPEWIELHPTETAGTLAMQAMRRLNSGWTPGEPIDAPNVWRIRAGDRVAFTGQSRPGVSADTNGLIEIFDFSENAMIVGEGRAAKLEDWLAFGHQDERDLTASETAAGRAAVAAVRSMAMPDSLSVSWYLER